MYFKQFYMGAFSCMAEPDMLSRIEVHGPGWGALRLGPWDGALLHNREPGVQVVPLGGLASLCNRDSFLSN